MLKRLMLPAVLAIVALLFVAACSSQRTEPAPASSSQASAAPSNASSQSQAPAEPAPKIKMNIGLATTADNSYSTEIAFEKGFFAKHGLDVELVAFQNASLSVQALQAGEIQITNAPPLSPMAARLKGARITIVGIHQPVTGWNLFALPDVNDVSELTSTSAVSFGPGSNGHAVALLYLEALGVDPDSITWTTSGDPAAQLQAVRQGGVKFVFLTENWVPMAEQLGLKVLRSSAELAKLYEFPLGGFEVDSEYLKNNREAVLAFLKGIGEATAFMKDDKNRDEAIRIIQKWNPGLTEQTAAEQLQYAVEQDVIVPKVTESQVELLKQLLITTGNTDAANYPASDFFDASLVEELEQSGFYAGL